MMQGVEKRIAGDDSRRMQLPQLDMLVEFDRVCGAHGGAVKIIAHFFVRPYKASA